MDCCPADTSAEKAGVANLARKYSTNTWRQLYLKLAAPRYLVPKYNIIPVHVTVILNMYCNLLELT